MIMPAYNFKAQFADAVCAHVKRQTIRAKRKHQPRIGQVAYCFTGMRTRGCRYLGEWIIRKVAEIRILEDGVILEGGPVRFDELDTFARMDGFESWPDMRRFFTKQHGLPFHGVLVIW